jgi:hypothetical protein
MVRLLKTWKQHCWIQTSGLLILEQHSCCDGKWKKEEVMKISKVTSIVKNCEGGIQGNITLSDVMFLPNGQYNLISITKVIQSGWKLEGNENMILLRKHNKKHIFEKIETSQGVSFALRIENGQELMTATVDNKLKQKRLTSMKPMLFFDIY